MKIKLSLIILMIISSQIHAQFCKVDGYAAISLRGVKCDARKVDRFFFSETLLPLDRDAYRLMKSVTAIIRREISRESKSFRSLPAGYQEKLKRDGLKLVSKVSLDWSDTFGEETYLVDFQLDNGKWVMLTLSPVNGRFRWDRLVASGM